MACEPDTSSEIVGWEAGERTCLHVRPGRVTMLECRFNKTTHHRKSKRQIVGAGKERGEIGCALIKNQIFIIA
jgi:hypothetical protein